MQTHPDNEMTSSPTVSPCARRAPSPAASCGVESRVPDVVPVRVEPFDFELCALRFGEVDEPSRFVGTDEFGDGVVDPVDAALLGRSCERLRSCVRGSRPGSSHCCPGAGTELSCRALRSCARPYAAANTRRRGGSVATSASARRSASLSSVASGSGIHHFLHRLRTLGLSRVTIAPRSSELRSGSCRRVAGEWHVPPSLGSISPSVRGHVAPPVALGLMGSTACARFSPSVRPFSALPAPVSRFATSSRRSPIHVVGVRAAGAPVPKDCFTHWSSRCVPRELRGPRAPRA